MGRASAPAGLALAALSLLAACGGRSDPVRSSGAGRSVDDGDSIVLNAMPPGANGNSAGGVGAPVGGQFVYPKHFRDALDLYGNLAYAQSPLKAEPCTPPATIDQHVEQSDLACNYFKHQGLEPDQVESSLDLTAPNGKAARIRRDGWGVPFVDGADRTAAMYAFGYAAAQDRLWLYDVLRYVGRGRLSEFLGPAPDTYAFDADLASVAGYEEAELTQMIEATAAKFGGAGAMVLGDLDAMIAGMNAYVAFLQTPAGASQVPPEYASLSLQPGNDLLKFPPRPFVREDVVASATLIQAIFAVGGGREQVALQLLQKLDAGFGPASPQLPKVACEFWRDVRHAEDPEAPLTITAAYATQSPGRVNESCPQALPAGAAIWDVGSLQPRATFQRSADGVPLPLPSANTAGNLLSPSEILPSLLPAFGLVPNPDNLARADEPRPPLRRRLPARELVLASIEPAEGARAALGRAGLPLPKTLSNFILVNGSQTKSGHPIAVMGPQASYFVPQLLWEVAIRSHGGTALDFAGRGAVFGNLPYINLGRGPDFSFSATSGSSDLVDIRVSRLCNVDGSTAARDDANGDGQGAVCRRLYRRVDEWVAHPTAASLALGGPTGPETVRRHVLRTHYGPVFATATINGQPVAISRQRSTFFGELDTALPFALVTTHTVKSAQDFQRLFNSMTGTFNWAYADADDIGYIHSGLYPKRAADVHPELPAWGDGRHEWAVDAAALDAAFFTHFGGSTPFPGRALPQPQSATPLADGYYEWPGYLSLAEHPQAINPARGYLVSWNNKPAKDWWAADFNGSYGPTHRSAMLERRLVAFQASGRKHDIASMIEIMADAAFTDLRGQELLPALLQLMQAGTLSADQQQVVALMQQWLDAGSMQWIAGTPGLGAWRRDRNHDDPWTYDQRAQVLLMDAWYPRLIEQVLPQLLAHEYLRDAQGQPVSDVLVGQGRYDQPRAQGSAYQEGWFEPMKRVVEMALGQSPAPYRQLRCADGTQAGCRAAVLVALDQALADLGGLASREQWTGSPLAPAGDQRVEEADAVRHTAFSFLPVPAIHWTNRPTFQQAVEYRQRRE